MAIGLILASAKGLAWAGLGSRSGSGQGQVMQCQDGWLSQVYNHYLVNLLLISFSYSVLLPRQLDISSEGGLAHWCIPMPDTIV